MSIIQKNVLIHRTIANILRLYNILNVPKNIHVSRSFTSETNEKEQESDRKCCFKADNSEKLPKEELQFEEMTIEELSDFFPESAQNFQDRPTFWPHDENEQF